MCWELYGLHQVLDPLCGLTCPSVKQKHAQACCAHLRGPVIHRGQDALMDGSYGTITRFCVLSAWRHLVHTILFHLSLAQGKWCRMIFKDEESVFLRTQDAPSAHGYPNTLNKFLPIESLSCPWALLPTKQVFPSNHPESSILKDDKRHAFSYLDFIRDADFFQHVVFLKFAR